VKRKGVPELVEALENETMPLDKAAKVAALPPEEQRRQLAAHQNPDPPTKSEKTSDSVAITPRLLEQYSDGAYYTVLTMAGAMKLPVPMVREHVEALVNGVDPHVFVERAGSGQARAYRFVVGDGRMIDAGIVRQELSRRVEQAKIPAEAEAAVAKVVRGLRDDVIERLARATVPRSIGKAAPRRIA